MSTLAEDLRMRAAIRRSATCRGAEDRLANQLDAAADALEKPVDLVLYCPKCGRQHIDTPAPDDYSDGMIRQGWDNPPHRSHLCAGCGHIWRPSDHATNGVERTASGKDVDTGPAALVADASRYRYLREHYRYGPPDKHRLEWYLPLGLKRLAPLGEQLDAHIDEAMARAKG